MLTDKWIDYLKHAHATIKHIIATHPYSQTHNATYIFPSDLSKELTKRRFFVAGWLFVLLIVGLIRGQAIRVLVVSVDVDIRRGTRFKWLIIDIISGVILNGSGFICGLLLAVVIIEND